MSLFVYCYGPFSTQKNLFCKNFLQENKNFKLVEFHKIRKKITGSILPINNELELQVKKEIEDKCADLIDKNASLLINGLFLNKKSRTILLDSIQNKTKNIFKKIAVGFPVLDTVEDFEKNQKDKSLKEVSFDSFRSQVSMFNPASTPEEADLLINKIDVNSQSLEIDTRLWGEDRIISCANFKKLAEYFDYSTSFN